MMLSTKPEVPQKTTLEIKQDDKFFTRLLSKETSISYPSFRISVAIPFVWESEPGTPKHTFSENCTLPPLTPPPSYYTNTSGDTKKHIKKRSNLFRTLFTKLNLNKTLLSSSSSSSSSSSLSSASWPTSNSLKVVPVAKLGRRRSLSSSSFDFRGDCEEDDSDSPRSSCFGIRRTASSDNGFRSCSRPKA